MTATEYLKSQGIETQSTVLISYIDGQLRNVDLVKLLEDYADTKWSARGVGDNVPKTGNMVLTSSGKYARLVGDI